MLQSIGRQNNHVLVNSAAQKIHIQGDDYLVRKRVGWTDSWAGKTDNTWDEERQIGRR